MLNPKYRDLWSNTRLKKFLIINYQIEALNNRTQNTALKHTTIPNIVIYGQTSAYLTSKKIFVFIFIFITKYFIMDNTTQFYPHYIQITYELHIAKYEELLKRELDFEELVDLAIKNEDYKLLNYLINRRLGYLNHLITTKTKHFGLIMEPINHIQCKNYTMFDQQYTDKLLYHTKNIKEDDDLSFVEAEDLIDEVGESKDIGLLWEIYMREKTNTLDYINEKISKHKESIKPKNRKFFIIGDA